MELPAPPYLTREELLDLHHRVIERYGGMPGIRDESALESCLAQPKTYVFDYERFPSVYQKAAAYCFFIIRLHPFFDGNKRAGLNAASHFLQKAFIELRADEEDLFRAIESVTVGQAEVPDLAELFRKTST